MPSKPAPSGQDRIVREIRATRGMSVRIAEACRIERSAVYQWKRVPATWVHEVAEIMGRPPEEIRPDIFRRRKQRHAVDR